MVMVVSNTEVRQVRVRGTVKVLPLAARHWRIDHLRLSQRSAAKRATDTETARRHVPPVTVSESMIAMIETGCRQPSRLVADCLAEAYGIPVGAIALVED